ncbi:uncharacterized protein LOC143785133 isoform X1 [Ranitomeya variabilis]|uniref:uncharacterized protein LOC143785133 isoform X1 n=1 Tax=Ranitomeya variabilis TaxID=490064 RepID=UPI004056B83D
MSPDYRNNFITPNYEPFEHVAEEPLEDNEPALHLITDTDTHPSVYMAEKWCIPEPCENLDSDVEIIDVKNTVISALADAPKRRGNSLSRCLKNRKVARKIQFEKENIPVSTSSNNAMSIKPGAAELQFPVHTYTPDLQPRVLHRRNYGSAQKQPQRANASVRSTPLSPICVVDREESYAAPKHTGRPSPKIPHQKYKNVSRERFAAQNASPCITQEANSTIIIPQVTPENREIAQLVAGKKSNNRSNIRVCQTVQSADTALAGSSSDFGTVLPLKKRSVSRRRVRSKKQKVAEHSSYTGSPVWDDEHIKMFIAMSGQYVHTKLAQIKLKSFCDTYERLINACPTPDIIAELYDFKLNHACVHTPPVNLNKSKST